MQEFRRSLGLSAKISDLSELEVDEPKSFKEAMNSRYANFWMPAFKEEFNAHCAIPTHKLVPLSALPPGAKPIPHKWVGKFKPGYGDVPARFKGRLTAVGCSQTYGVDYLETYAPVPRLESFRVFLSIVASLDLEMIQIDIKTAFLAIDIDYPIYMTQPEGFVVPGKEDWVWECLKAIYGTKQASHLFGVEVKDHVKQFKLVALTADGCVYVRIVGDEFSILITYVDDCLYATNKPETCEQFLTHMAKKFEIRQLPPSRFLGINIQRDRANHRIFISQEHTVKNLLEKYNMADSKPVAVPADPHSHLSANMLPTAEGESQLDMNNVPYRAAVGALIYVGNATRPDISFAVHQAARFSSNPLPAHWSAVKRVLRYLKGTQSLGIWLGGGGEEVVVYGDADFAADTDTRKSTSGLIGFLRGGPVSWASRRQSTVATSTTQSEFNALTEAAKDAVWLRRFNAEFSKSSSGDLKKPAAVKVFCDNQPAVKLSKNPEFHRRTKHFDIEVHYVRELQEKGEIEVCEVDTRNQLADIFTKPLKPDNFIRLREMIGMGRIGL